MTSRPWLTLAILLAATFMGVLDIFIVNVALPAVQSQLRASFGDLQLVVAGYTLAYAVGLVTGGRLGDTFGRREVFMTGTALFGLASIGCSVAPTPGALIVLRIVQGLSAAVMLPQVLAMIQLIFPEDKRAKAIGFYGATIGLGAVLGQIVGGALLAWNPLDLGWRSIFLVNVPLCVLTVIGTRLTIGRIARGAGAKLDLVGVVLLGLALFGLLHPVIMAGQSGWSGTSTVEIVAAALLFVVFVWWERRLSGHGGQVLLPPSLFAQEGFRKGLATALFFYSGNAGFLLILSYFLQRGLHLTPMRSAMVFSPMALAMAVTSLSIAWLRARFGHWIIVLGGVVSVIGLLVCLPAVGLEPGLGQLVLLQPGLLLYGLGGGLVAPSVVGLTLARISPDDVGAASGGLLTVTQAANAIGVAALGAVFAALAAGSPLAYAFTLSLLLVSALGLVTVGMLVAIRKRPEDAPANG